MISKIRGFFGNLNIRFKIFLICALSVSISLAIFFVFSFYQIKQGITQSQLYSIEHSSLLSQNYISKFLDDITNIAYVLSDGHNIGKMLVGSNKSSYFTQFKNLNEVEQLFSYYNNSPDIISIELYANSDADIFIDNSSVFPLASAKNSLWYDIMVSNSYLFFSYIDSSTPDNVCFSTVAAIRNPYDLSKTAGYIKINLDTASMRQILLHSTISENSVTLISDAQTGGAYTSNENTFSEYGFSADALSELPYNKIQILKGSGRAKYHVIKRYIKKNGWSYFLISPVYEAQHSVIMAAKVLLIAFILLLICTYLISYFLSLTVTKPINDLTHSIKATGLGQFVKVNSDNYSNDMKELFSSYNNMIEYLTTLIRHEFESGVKFEKLEMELLQSQINPHFLYNTLDLIKALATTNNTETIRSVIGSLAKFYKISLHNGKSIVTVNDELHHIASYVDIQNARFDNAIVLSADVSEVARLLPIPKVTFQPIVENSIYHGIFRKKSRSGKISVKSYMYDDCCIISIKDNGVGISPEKTALINSGQLTDCFGLYNTNRRLKILFGVEYGINVKSKEGEYTEVEIKIPTVSEND